MSQQPCPDPVPGAARAADQIDTVIIPRARNIGGCGEPAVPRAI